MNPGNNNVPEKLLYSLLSVVIRFDVHLVEGRKLRGRLPGQILLSQETYYCFCQIFVEHVFVLWQPFQVLLCFFY